jgi:Zn-dependent protease with chaperone function
MSFTVFTAALVLLSLPAAAYKLGRRIKPAHWTRVVVVALSAGAALLVFGLLLTAAPAILSASGLTGFARLCQRLAGHSLPGGPFVAWLAGAGAVLLIAASVIAAFRTALAQRRMVSMAAGGVDRPRFGQYRVIEVQSPAPMAVALREKSGTIVVTSALADLLSRSEWEAVVRHEVEHVRSRHWRHLVLAAVIERMLGWVPPVSAGVSVLRLALEREADEAAAGPDRRHRALVRSALAKLATVDLVASSAPAFASDAPVAERLQALDQLPRSSTRAFLSVHTAMVAAMTAGALGVGLWIGHAHYLATSVLCPI